MDGTLMGLPFMVRRIPKFRFMAPEVWRLGCQGPKGHVLPHTLGRWHIYLSPMGNHRLNNDPNFMGNPWKTMDLAQRMTQK
jgi:hypothetical protein